MRTVLVADGLRVHKVFKVASATISDAMSSVAVRMARPEERGQEYRWMVCRHPLDRLVSVFTYFCTGRYLGRIEMGICKGMPWDDFLHVALGNPYGDKHLRPQIIAAGPYPLDKLCWLEDLTEEWEVLRERFSYLLPLKWLMKTEHKPWQEYYTPSQRIRAEVIYAHDLVLYESVRVVDIGRDGRCVPTYMNGGT